MSLPSLYLDIPNSPIDILMDTENHEDEGSSDVKKTEENSQLDRRWSPPKNFAFLSKTSKQFSENSDGATYENEIGVPMKLPSIFLQENDQGDDRSDAEIDCSDNNDRSSSRPSLMSQLHLFNPSSNDSQQTISFDRGSLATTADMSQDNSNSFNSASFSLQSLHLQQQQQPSPMSMSTPSPMGSLVTLRFPQLTTVSLPVSATSSAQPSPMTLDTMTPHRFDMNESCGVFEPLYPYQEASRSGSGSADSSPPVRFENEANLTREPPTPAAIEAAAAAIKDQTPPVTMLEPSEPSKEEETKETKKGSSEDDVIMHTEKEAYTSTQPTITSKQASASSEVEEKHSLVPQIPQRPAERVAQNRPPQMSRSSHVAKETASKEADEVDSTPSSSQESIIEPTTKPPAIVAAFTVRDGCSGGGAAEESSEGSGDEAPMFSVLDGLGRGGYSTVVKVENVMNQKVYAMKVITKNICKDRARRMRHHDQLEVEIEIMTKVTPSPFIQRCFYTFESISCVYCILELNTGGDLFYHLTQRTKNGTKFFEEECRTLLAEIYLAVEHLHLNGYIHRDLKIENVMLNTTGHVKLIDFGLAVEIETLDDEIIQPMNAVGSLISMAPELIKERSGGRHTDWWAYGVLSYELMTGKTPWSSKDNRAIIKDEIVNYQFAPVIPTLSMKASNFILALLNRDVYQRLGSKRDSEIKENPFFATPCPSQSTKPLTLLPPINWKLMAQLKTPPAFNILSKTVNIKRVDQNKAVKAYFDLNNKELECIAKVLERKHLDRRKGQQQQHQQQSKPSRVSARQFSNASSHSSRHMSHEEDGEEEDLVDRFWYLGLEKSSKYLL